MSHKKHRFEIKMQCDGEKLRCFTKGQISDDELVVVLQTLVQQLRPLHQQPRR